MKVLLLQLDGAMPNIALMRLSAHHKRQGDRVHLLQLRRPDAVPTCPISAYDRVYASLLFTKTRPVAEKLLEAYPKVILGGTGWDLGSSLEQLGVTSEEKDYSVYPACTSSIGFTQRGCRLNCKFCVVPEKEGDVAEVATIADIWRGPPWPKHLLLLDNDFFGQPRWRARIEEIRQGGFKVSFNQGINARMLSDEAAAAIASVDYRDNEMDRKRIYTAWDSMGDEGPLFRGLQSLVKHGVRPAHIMVYMLIGYEQPAVTEADLYRIHKLRDFGCLPYPMPYVRNSETIGFQRWAVAPGHFYKFVPWPEWVAARYQPRNLTRK